MRVLIIKEDLSTESFEHLVFVNPTKEECFIHLYAPVAKCVDDSSMRWTVASGNDGNSDRTVLPWELLLNV